jgi:hypothetical protein
MTGVRFAHARTDKSEPALAGAGRHNAAVPKGHKRTHRFRIGDVQSLRTVQGRYIREEIAMLRVLRAQYAHLIPQLSVRAGNKYLHKSQIINYQSSIINAERIL